MSNDDQVVSSEVLRLRARRDEWHRQEKANRGEAEYARLLKAREAVLQELRNRVDPLVAEARSRGFVYFRTMRDLSPAAIRLQFADGHGLFYERSLGIERLAAKYGLPGTWFTELEPLIHFYGRSLDGIRMLAHGMQVKRVRATAPALVDVAS